MDSIFDRMCSVYTDAKDNVGRFVDMETGEIIQSMTIREFCMTDRWQPVVEKLRGMVETMGEKAAKASDGEGNGVASWVASGTAYGIPLQRHRSSG